ncbi:DUF1642 domain-containing protein [Lacticaseibacillus paracasei]|uniref:DUF1642 domain-containing protein n=1 Tax=Lacticaseibacillus paracasei TaxID=1597 RepID=UPI0021A4E839|nr:DUF1642 domain-containing protein [Lacticaseibacillus paracasei]UWP75606.1 DUF1642 domain-containing protein [Lacticaseibacillus paracasei]
MSEEKLYAVKNDEDEWLDQDHLFGPGAWATPDKDEREKVAKRYGCHVVALVEEPKKVVLSEEQAKIVKNAHGCDYPLTSISGDAGENSNSDDEELLMNAYVNGYTVAKEKKYNVKVPYAEGWHFQKYSPESKRGLHNNWRPFPAKDVDSNMSKDLFLFTEAEIEHYGLQDCEKEEVTDDEV